MPKAKERKPAKIKQRTQGLEPTCFPTTISMLGYNTEKLKDEARRRGGIGRGRWRRVMRDIGGERVKDPTLLDAAKHTVTIIRVAQGLHAVMVDKNGRYRNPWYPFGIPFGRRILQRHIRKGKVDEMFQVADTAPFQGAPIRKPFWRKFLPS